MVDVLVSAFDIFTYRCIYMIQFGIILSLRWRVRINIALCAKQIFGRKQISLSTKTS
jgi:hypothetical protein